MTSLRRVTWKGNVDCALIVAALVTLPLRAQADPPQADASAAQPGSFIKDTLGVSGSVRSALFTRDTSFSGNTGYAVDSLWLTAKPEEVYSVKTYFDARVQGQNLTRNSNLSWELREGYAETSFGDLDLKAGRQITIWGRADKINPTDVWSTRDYTLLTTDDEDQRLGVSSFQAAWNQGYFRLIGIWQPEWRTPVYPIPPLPAGVTVHDLKPSDQASQVGVKLDHSGGSTDFSFSYAHVISRIPDLSVLSSGPQGTQTGLQFEPIDVLGADAAVVAGDYGFRAEGAYTRTQDNGGTNPFAQNDNFFGVLGVDRTFGGELNINLQYLYKHVFGWDNPSQISNANARFLASEEDLLSNQLGANMNGASARINYKAFNETLECELAGVAWVNPGDYALRPKMSYAFSDSIKGVVGGQVYWGEKDTLFGSLNHTSTAFVELRLGF